MTYSAAQKIKANETLGGFAAQGAVFTNEVFQGSQYIFRATLPNGQCKFVIIAKGGRVVDHGWS